MFHILGVDYCVTVIDMWWQYSRWGRTRLLYSNTSISSSRLSKVRRMSPITWLALFACVTVWVSNFSFSSTMTPRSLSSLTSYRHVSHILYSYCGFWFPICRTLHLSALNFIFHVLAQFWRLSRSYWRSLRSCSVIMALKTFASSANISIQLVTTSGIMSFMNISALKNGKAPSLDN